MERKIRKLVVSALLTAAALIIFVIEAQIPPLVPIPGIKLGLANVVTLAAIYMVGKAWGSAVQILRIVLGTLFTGQAVSFLYSISGGMVALLLMLLLTALLSKRWLWLISAAAAVGHAAAQMCIAMWLLGTTSVWLYAPLVFFSAIVTGIFTGLCVQVLFRLHPKFLDWANKQV